MRLLVLWIEGIIIQNLIFPNESLNINNHFASKCIDAININETFNYFPNSNVNTVVDSYNQNIVKKKNSLMKHKVL